MNFFVVGPLRWRGGKGRGGEGLEILYLNVADMNDGFLVSLTVDGKT